MENLDKETIEKIISELLKVLKKLEEKEDLKKKGRDIRIVEAESRTSGSIGRVIGTFAKINDLDIGLKFSGESNDTINLDFNDVLFNEIEKDSLKSVIKTEVDKNSLLKDFNFEIE